MVLCESLIVVLENWCVLVSIHIHRLLGVAWFPPPRATEVSKKVNVDLSADISENSGLDMKFITRNGSFSNCVNIF